MIKKKYRILNFICSNCAITIESLEDDLPGVISISASYHKGEIMVEFDECQINENDIIAALNNKGYTVNE
jgi:copper chaperone CopZ